MIDQQQGSDQRRESRRRSVGIVSFVAGLVVTLAFFAFFPGLPHVIDSGAIVVAVLAGTLTRWVCQDWMAKRSRENK
ncbi:hypothetical protein AB0D14_09850 [Streptomyces sp. NPDC048484]|uniref:hypothetical protein n=1 Tax=Streptomyces sp. NPDC048484 TaxID=3155146 RepID=UPI00341E96E1